MSSRGTLRRAGALALLLALLPVSNTVTATAAPSCGSSINVPGAQLQRVACLADLTTAGLVGTDYTNKADWSGLNAAGAINPTGVSGIQVDGYFPDDDTLATNPHNTNHGWNHDAQFVIRLPDHWNGKLVITGAPGVRRQYANDFIISDWVLARGYAFASTDKGNSGVTFYRDGSTPGDAVLEWHRRVTELTLAAKQVVEQAYGHAPRRTYVTGVSNGGYLTRWAIEHHPGLYDGAVDWEGTLFRERGPNLFTYLPTALKEYPIYAAGGADAAQAHAAMLGVGFAPGSEFLWPFHYAVYWDLTQRIYRQEFDPSYSGPYEAGRPFCVSATPFCDTDYNYFSRPESVPDAVGRVSLSGRIGKPMITLHGTLDSLLPIATDSDVYNQLIKKAGRRHLHRYYTVEAGNHVDGLYDFFPDKLRPILPCYRAAFEALEKWVESGDRDDSSPPRDQLIHKPTSGDVVNRCALATNHEDDD